MTAVIQGAFGTALLNFGPRTNNMGHGPLDFSRVKANFSAGYTLPLCVVRYEQRKDSSSSFVPVFALLEGTTPTMKITQICLCRYRNGLHKFYRNRFDSPWPKIHLKPGFHIVVSVVSVVRKKFIGQLQLYGNLPYKCSIQKKRQMQLFERDRMNSICPMNFFRTTDTTTDTTIWKPGLNGTMTGT